MKILLTEKERMSINELLDKMEVLCDSEDVKVLNDIRTSLKEKTEIKEEYIIEACLRSGFILDETKDAAVDLNRAYMTMKGEWNSVLIKVYAKASKVFLLHNTWTKRFFESVQYYVARFKKAYDDMLLKDFTVRPDTKEEPVMSDEIRPSVDGHCIGGSCHQCEDYDNCPTGQMSEY